MKRIFLIMTFSAFASFASANSDAYKRNALHQEVPLGKTRLASKQAFNTVNEVYYEWNLLNDGCFHLFRVVVVGPLEFVTAVQEGEWTLNITHCTFSQDYWEALC